MEGLIPLVYKSIKRSRTLRKYEFLSSENVEAGYTLTSNLCYTAPPPEAEKTAVEAKVHRRHKSCQVEYYPAGRLSPDHSSAKPGKLVRFGSQKMFTCLN
ncbi:unnamed protein product [Cuscuta europaea]|uniref:Uncharacterized protein n=1 Tax=Cuscuta europaea TaxID=41803 RepID=A0A9P0YV38_CUSEU|nr:unnamed protein product [Cuscuta europaea]